MCRHSYRKWLVWRMSAGPTQTRLAPWRLGLAAPMRVRIGDESDDGQSSPRTMRPRCALPRSLLPARATLTLSISTISSYAAPWHHCWSRRPYSICVAICVRLCVRHEPETRFLCSTLAYMCFIATPTLDQHVCAAISDDAVARCCGVVSRPKAAGSCTRLSFLHARAKRRITVGSCIPARTHVHPRGCARRVAAVARGSLRGPAVAGVERSWERGLVGSSVLTGPNVCSTAVCWSPRLTRACPAPHDPRPWRLYRQRMKAP